MMKDKKERFGESEGAAAGDNREEKAEGNRDPGLARPRSTDCEAAETRRSGRKRKADKQRSDRREAGRDPGAETWHEMRSL
jgi:hypothetical protein